MSGGATKQPDTAHLLEIVMEHLDTFGQSLAVGAHARIERLSRIGDDLDQWSQTLFAAGWSPITLIACAGLTAAATLAAFAGAKRLLIQHKPGQSAWRRLGLGLGIAIVSFGLGALLAGAIGSGQSLVRRTLHLWALAAVLGSFAVLVLDVLICRQALSARQRLDDRPRRFVRRLGTAIAWALAGIAGLTTLRLWNAGLGLRDLVGTLLVVLPVAVLFTAAYWRSHRVVAVVLAGPKPRTRGRLSFAKAWPVVAPMLILATLLLAQVANTLDRPLPPLSVLVTVLLVITAPHFEVLIARWAAAGMTARRVPVALIAWRRTARVSLIAAVVTYVAAVWGAPIAAAAGADLSALARPAIEISGIVFVTAFLWNVVGVASDRILEGERPRLPPSDEEEGNAPRSRVGTILPLVAGVAKAGLLALATLSVLLALSVNVWPLITGLSIFGLAIGFGSQTLVRDIISGFFFLLDDAFRLGEYIETSGAKGTVEKISIRSVSLRHPRGALTTIPYGQIGKIENHSRDWVIEKLAFRVAFDTDVEKVRKLFKKVGQEIAADPELAQNLLEPFKSQGIAAVEDGTLVIRGKFKAKAARQFQIRKAVLAAVQRVFRENGIRVVGKPILDIQNVDASNTP